MDESQYLRVVVQHAQTQSSGNSQVRASKRRCIAAAVLLLAGLLVVAAFPLSAGAQVPQPPRNGNCEGAAVVVKLSVVEDVAAANMLAEAATTLGLGQRCLVDAGDPDAGRAPARSRSELRNADQVFVVGGPKAIAHDWLSDQLGVSNYTRIAGGNRWETQAAVASAIISLARGEPVVPYRGQPGSNPVLPPNTGCKNAVLVKLNVLEDQAAANMLAETFNHLSASGTDRCLVDVGDPARDEEPDAIDLIRLKSTEHAHIVGGPSAIPDDWIRVHFGFDDARRIQGQDRWATQAAIADAIVLLARESAEQALTVAQRFPERVERARSLAAKRGQGRSSLNSPSGAAEARAAQVLCRPPSRDRWTSRVDEVEILHYDLDTGDIYLCYQPLAGRTLQEAREQIASADRSVLAVDRIYVPEPQVPNDADARRSQWHLDSTDGINAAALWDLGSVGLTPVTVAVIDTGIDRSHPAFEDALVEPAEGAGCRSAQSDYFTRDRITGQPTNGHGTHVAGIVAARPVNGGVSGVMPDARILPLAFLGYVDLASMMQPEEHGEELDLIECAIASDAKVINMSYSRAASTTNDLQTDLLSIEHDDVVFVAAAGNCGGSSYAANNCASQNQLRNPAADPNVIAVAATEQDGTRASFSNVNSSVLVAAPGLEIVSTVPGGEVEAWDGTSMAAPIVSGVVVHMLAHCPSANRSDIIEVLMETSGDGDGIRDSDELGYGVVRPVEAIERLRSRVAGCADLGPPEPDQRVVLSMGADARDQGGCRSDNLHCRWLRVQLEGFAPGAHRVQCFHDDVPAHGWTAGSWISTDRNFGSSLSDEGACWFGVEGVEVHVVVDGVPSNICLWRSNGDCDTQPPDRQRVNIGWGTDATGRGNCLPESNCHNLEYEIIGIDGPPYILSCRSGSPSVEDWTGTWSGRAHTGCYYGGGTYDVWVEVNGVRSNVLSTATRPGALDRQAPEGTLENDEPTFGDKDGSYSWWQPPADVNSTGYGSNGFWFTLAIGDAEDAELDNWAAWEFDAVDGEYAIEAWIPSRWATAIPQYLIWADADGNGVFESSEYVGSAELDQAAGDEWRPLGSFDLTGRVRIEVRDVRARDDWRNVGVVEARLAVDAIRLVPSP